MSDVTLTDFLLERIAEDKAAANAADWAMQGKWYEPEESADGSLVARYSPARVLAECAAKRRIVAEHRIDPCDWPGRGGFGCVICANGCDWGLLNDGYCTTLKALAAVFADHPDYRAEWGVE